LNQTLKRWLGARPPARDLHGLQNQLDAFAHYYNNERPHRSLNRRTPVNLQPRHGKSAQVCEAAIARAEVIESDTEAIVRDALQGRRRRGGLRHNRCLGDFKAHVTRRQPRQPGRLTHGRRQVAVGQMERRDVD